MVRIIPLQPAIAGVVRALGAVCLASFVAQAPAHAGGDISNFKVKNCTTERMFVCSFDKTDSLMNIPYKAAGVQPGDKKEFGCASIGRCKVIIGVSKKKSKSTLSSGMKTAVAAGSATAAGVAAGAAGGAAASGAGATGGGALYVFGAGELVAPVAAAASTSAVLTTTAAAAAVVAVAAGGAVAALEISDGWSDGEVCNQVRKAAQNAGLKPKDFMQNGKTYTVVGQYAVNKDGNPFVNADGTAAFAYKTQKGNTCPSSLKAQLVPN